MKICPLYSIIEVPHLRCFLCMHDVADGEGGTEREGATER